MSFAPICFISNHQEKLFVVITTSQRIYIYCEQNDVIVERCTGLKDKNGKLIFEGDIIRSENFFGIVEFGKYRASYDSVNLGFYIKWGKKQSELRKDIFYWHETYGLKVVGNIHEDIDEYIGKHNIEREEE